jgi:hypothetical protein
MIDIIHAVKYAVFGEVYKTWILTALCRDRERKIHVNPQESFQTGRLK